MRLDLTVLLPTALLRLPVVAVGGAKSWPVAENSIRKRGANGRLVTSIDCILSTLYALSSPVFALIA